jgi:hypothetical protein
MTEAADQIAANWAQVLAAISVAAGAVIAVVTIRSGRRISRQENTFRYLERQDLAEFRASIASARLVWGLRGRSPGVVTAAYDSLPYIQQVEVIRVLDMYDEICTIYQSGLFDESVFVTMFAPYVMAYWREAHCLISHLRKRPPA